jgi:ribosomal protein L11 methylase PrmA
VTAFSYDPGSFRDPDGRVAHRGGEVVRLLSERALRHWRAAAATSFYREAAAAGRIVAAAEGDAAGAPAPWRGILRVERIPVVTYPYEWPFGMLRDAALLQLDLLEAALTEGFTLKDATPFNVQWRGADPVFVDVGSFEPFAPGSLWAGYRQFCETFLNPLLLTALLGVDFQPWLRGRIDGIPSADLAPLLGIRHRLRPSILKHVVLHARLAAGFAPSLAVQGEVRGLGADTAPLVRANLRSLRRLVASLAPLRSGSGWTGYDEAAPYAAADRERKEAFVRAALASLRPRRVLDLGCNTGAYSRIAAETAEIVVAVDSDHAAVQSLYESLASGRARTVLPLVWDFADPSPGLGWRRTERAPLHERFAPDAVVALAVVHHLALGRNLPLDQVVEEMAALGGDLVVEFPTLDDPMVKSILGRKATHSAGWDAAAFEGLLAARYVVEERAALPGGTRILYRARRRR